MTIETVAVILAVAFAIQSVAIGFFLLRLLPVLRQFNELSEDVKGVVKKVEGVADQLQSTARGVKTVSERVQGVATRVLDEIEPPVRRLAGLMTGVRASLTSLMKHPVDSNGHPEPKAS